ncbi:Rhodanese-related sulfurtransferase [Lutibacter oricola]|uniref:Rhodanese-related sulfurtransferase n=1 Tax=Lutibacter oricola TaxID=762486 RepID=A0A1H3CFG5_9FLAO|nr:rhodanese-like domain-containing protein [Lutibacter oricola]SDX52873.1 Rhodanese-related sulfurtransferase [Lutibacter oricola]
MKELEKTKRISIAAVITILVVIIALLTYKKPKHLYTVNTQQALEQTALNNFIQKSELNSETILIDIRNKFEFEKGHIENAINIDASDILLEDNKNVFETLKEEGKNVALYGNTPSEAIAPLMVLQQLGFNNVKILAVNNSLNQDKLITTPAEIEKKGENINKFIETSAKKVNELMKAKPKPKPVVKAPVKKVVIPKKKKKKMPVEGGC